MLERFNEMLKNSEGSDEKIQKFLSLKKELNQLLIEYNKNTDTNIKFKIINGYIEEIKFIHKYTDKSLFENNIELLKISFLNILSPLKARSIYNSFYINKENKVKEKDIKYNSKMIKEIFDLKEIKENNIKFEKEERFRFIETKNEEETKEKEKNQIKKLYSISIFQPSFEILKELTTTIELIDNIELEIFSNQEKETRAKFTKVILPSGKGERIIDRDNHLQPTEKNLIKNIFAQDNQDFSLNINIIINMTRELNFQEEIIIKKILEKNGIYVKTKKALNPQSITDFDLLMVLSNLKVNI